MLYVQFVRIVYGKPAAVLIQQAEVHTNKFFEILLAMDDVTSKGER